MKKDFNKEERAKKVAESKELLERADLKLVFSITKSKDKSFEEMVEMKFTGDIVSVAKLLVEVVKQDKTLQDIFDRIGRMHILMDMLGNGISVKRMPSALPKMLQSLIDDLDENQQVLIAVASERVNERFSQGAAMIFGDPDISYLLLNYFLFKSEEFRTIIKGYVVITELMKSEGDFTYEEDKKITDAILEDGDDDCDCIKCSSRRERLLLNNYSKVKESTDKDVTEQVNKNMSVVKDILKN